jgi:polysaccharide pyruvyl transferase WcaK-like protein
MTRKPRILIYSAAVRIDDGIDLNLGDEALSECLAAALATAPGGTEVRRLVGVWGQRAALTPGERPLGLRAVVEGVRWADVVVLGGGTLLQDDAGLLRWQTLIATIARALRKPVVLAAVGAEGLREGAPRRMARYVCRRASAITVRDRASGALVERISGRDAEVTADPVLLTHSLLAPFEPDPIPKGWVLPGALLAVNLTREAPQGLIDTLARWRAREVADGTAIVGVAMDRRPGRDALALERLGDALGWPAGYSLLPAHAGWREVCAVLGSCRVCIGMRLHFMLLATIVCAPVLAIATLPKTVAFAEELATSRIGAGASGAELDEALDLACSPNRATLAALGERATNTITLIASTASPIP